MKETLIRRITRLREARGWSETDLAREAKLSQSTISCWNNKTENPSITSLEKVCEALEVSLGTMLNEDDNWYDITDEEREMLEHFRKLSEVQKKDWLRFLSDMVRK